LFQPSFLCFFSFPLFVMKTPVVHPTCSRLFFLLFQLRHLYYHEKTIFLFLFNPFLFVSFHGFLFYSSEHHEILNLFLHDHPLSLSTRCYFTITTHSSFSFTPFFSQNAPEEKRDRKKGGIIYTIQPKDIIMGFYNHRVPQKDLYFYVPFHPQTKNTLTILYLYLLLNLFNFQTPFSNSFFPFLKLAFHGEHHGLFIYFFPLYSTSVQRTKGLGKLTYLGGKRRVIVAWDIPIITTIATIATIVSTSTNIIILSYHYY